MLSRIAKTLDAMTCGVGRASTPVQTSDGLSPSAARLAAACPGDLLLLDLKFGEGQTTIEIVGSPREYEHPWYKGVRVIERKVRKPRGRNLLTLSIYGDDEGGVLIGRGLGERVASILPSI